MALLLFAVEQLRLDLLSQFLEVFGLDHLAFVVDFQAVLFGLLDDPIWPEALRYRRS
jgi:hypothetical protein